MWMEMLLNGSYPLQAVSIHDDINGKQLVVRYIFRSS
jgi:hypothetical protein